MSKDDKVLYDDVIESHGMKGAKYSLYCKTCDSWVPNTANYEMKKEGCVAHSHSCIKYPDGTIRGRDSGGAVPNES